MEALHALFMHSVISMLTSVKDTWIGVLGQSKMDICKMQMLCIAENNAPPPLMVPVCLHTAPAFHLLTFHNCLNRILFSGTSALTSATRSAAEALGGPNGWRTIVLLTLLRILQMTAWFCLSEEASVQDWVWGVGLYTPFHQHKHTSVQLFHC